YAWNTYDILDKILKKTTPASALHAIIENESLRFPKGSLRMRFNTNHDKNAWDAPAVEKFGTEGAKLTAALMFTFPGVPLIYNGEEVGNPKRLALFEKVPIEWKDQGGFRRLYQELIRMRMNHPVFRHGEYRAIRNTDPGHVYSFARTGEEETAVCVFNCSGQTAKVSLSLEDLAGPVFKEVLTGETVTGAAPEVTLRPLSFKIFTASGTRK
ncbi:MAG TPA: alpha-glucosidase C-terminal domain-containing protein, partial [Bacteroidota bacterium]